MLSLLLSYLLCQEKFDGYKLQMVDTYTQQPLSGKSFTLEITRDGSVEFKYQSTRNNIDFVLKSAESVQIEGINHIVMNSSSDGATITAEKVGNDNEKLRNIWKQNTKKDFKLIIDHEHYNGQKRRKFR
jgi:hypothetical protein